MLINFLLLRKTNGLGLNGEWTLPGLDVSKFDGYRAVRETVLQVGNLFQQRILMRGYSISQEIVGNQPLTILGINPNIPNS